MSNAEDTVVLYCAAWLEPDEAQRNALLEKCWTEGGVYQDPTADVRGRGALAAHIGAFHERFPGARLERQGETEDHHGKVSFRWHIVAGDGTEVVSGIDFGVFAADGRLDLIVGFFGSHHEEA